jgi:hypothetical protein
MIHSSDQITHESSTFIESKIYKRSIALIAIPDTNYVDDFSDKPELI